MSEMKDLYVLIITTLMALLIMGIVLIEFEILDTTLVAGIVAFCGAIIGGSITLIGVNKTIKDGRERDKRKVYFEKLGDRAMLKYDVTEKLSEMKFKLSQVFKNIDFDDFNDDEILDTLNYLYDCNENLLRDGIRIGEDNFTTLKELKGRIEALFGYYHDMKDENDIPEETYHFQENYDKEEIFNLLDDAIDGCYKKSNYEKERLFDEVFEISKN